MPHKALEFDQAEDCLEKDKMRNDVLSQKIHGHPSREPD